MIMERTKFSSINKSRIRYSIEEEPIVLSKHLLDTLLEEKNPAELIALYCFYYYTAKWQKTNQPKATTEYTSKGLSWSMEKVRKIKHKLVQLKLIEDKIYKNKNTGKVQGHYIKVYFICSKNHTMDFPEGGESHTMDFEGGNALSSNNINALSSNKENNSLPPNKKAILEQREKEYLPLAKQLSEIVSSHKKIEITSNKIKAWAKPIRLLSEQSKIPFDRIKKDLDWYSIHIGEHCVPEIYCGESLKEKFIKLESAMEREKQDRRKLKQNTPINTIGSRRFGDKIEYNKKAITKY